jgi:hypothetical protein
MKFILHSLLALSCAFTQLNAHDPASDMAFAAKRFLQSLDVETKKKAHFVFKNKERENWHFFPGPFIDQMEDRVSRSRI